MFYSFITALPLALLQPVPEKMELGMEIGMEIGILNGLLSDGSFEKEHRPFRILTSIPMTIRVSSFLEPAVQCVSCLTQCKYAATHVHCSLGML